MRAIRTLFIAAALAFVPGIAHGSDAAAAPSVDHPPRTGAPWTTTEIAGLRHDLDALVARTPTLRGAHLGVIVETPAGAPLYAMHPDDAVQPASTFKLLVGSTALDRLGPDYRFRTTLTRLSGGPLGRDRLVLHGGGDPLFSAADLDAAADAAQRAGVSSTVELSIDTSHVSPDVRKGYGWMLDDVLWSYQPVVNGLPFEENVLAAWLDPAATIGMPPAVRLAPPYVAQLLAPGACPGGPTLLTFSIQARTVAAGAPSTVDVTPGRCGEIVVRGDVPQGHPTSLALAVDAPEELARLDFVAALGRRGIAVADPPIPSASAPLAGITDIPAPADDGASVVWTHDGEPLARLLADFWLPSDNLVGEELFYELDAALNHHAGAAGGAAQVENDWLRGVGVDPRALEIDDGSGLSQYDRITPRILATILRHDWNGPYHDIVLDALPVLGVRGDIGSIGRGTAAAGRVFAKGGSMFHIRGLAGYVATASHGTAVVVISVDDWLGDEADLDAFRAAFCSRIAGD
jgi:D-alanyl-D-alanine carboxypeptidase/D-alanyl-D-alanine-endopeptidase (penicillin-binding protein 4)